MRTVNEMVFNKVRERTAKENEIFDAVFTETLKDEEDFWVLQDLQKVYCSSDGNLHGIIPRFGETAFNETIGCLGIWLAQFGDETFDSIMDMRKRRQKFEPLWQGKPTC